MHMTLDLPHTVTSVPHSPEPEEVRHSALPHFTFCSALDWSSQRTWRLQCSLALHGLHVSHAGRGVHASHVVASVILLAVCIVAGGLVAVHILQHKERLPLGIMGVAPCHVRAVTAPADNTSVRAPAKHTSS